jgi:hypothetical protein
MLVERPIADIAATTKVRDAILAAYDEFEAQHSSREP